MPAQQARNWPAILAWQKLNIAILWDTHIAVGEDDCTDSCMSYYDQKDSFKEDIKEELKIRVFCFKESGTNERAVAASPITLYW